MFKWKKNPLSLPKSMYGGVGKRLFISLMSGACIMLCTTILVAWLIPYIGFSQIHFALPWILAFLSCAFIIYVLWVCISIIYHVYTGNQIFGLHKVHGITVKLMFPLMDLLGRAVGVSREKMRLSFVKVNNEIVLGKLMREGNKIKASKVLLLLPHCIQNSNCPHRLTLNINLCKRCGQCPMGDILNLRDQWGFNVVIATGGTIARKIVVELKPKLILAVACERDLTSGIQDTYPLLVYGLINQRPFGPCINTLIDIELLEKSLHNFVLFEEQNLR